MVQYAKEALAEQLKVMLRTKSLDKITVKELVEECDINRQTFYYHFHDIYDLLGWIYKTEAINSIENKRSYETWHDGLLVILKYVEDNKMLCINTYRSLARDHLEGFLDEVLFDLLVGVVDEIAKDSLLNRENRDFIVRFYSHAFGGILLDWIADGIKTNHEKIANNIIEIMEGNIQSAVDRFSDKS